MTGGYSRNFMGQEKEPPSAHKGKGGKGKHPPVHSHSKKIARKITPGKRAR